MHDVCWRTGKIQYLSAVSAFKTLETASRRRRKFKPRGSAYRCKFCHRYHTTSEARGR